MSKFVRLCKNCNKNSSDESSLRGKGYSIYLPEDRYICEICGGELIDLSMLSLDYDVLTNISNDSRFIESMIELAEKDPIEYHLKMSQFKNNVQQQTSNIKIDNTPKCPTCNSTNIKKISGLSKAGSVAMWGLLSRKVHKQWHCNQCGSEW